MSDNKSTKKNQVLLLGLNQSLIDTITGDKENDVFKDCELVAALVGDQNLQGRVIRHNNGMLFIAKPDEFSKFKFHFVIMVEENSQNINFMLNQLLNLKVDPSRIKVFQKGKILDVNVKQTQVLPPIKMKPGPKLYFEVSDIVNQYHTTGIQRVVTKLYNSFEVITKRKFIPIQWLQDGITTSKKFECRVNHQEFDHKEHRVKLTPKDKVLLPDTLWNVPKSYNFFAAEAEKDNLTTYFMVYDLIPIRYAKTIPPLAS